MIGLRENIGVACKDLRVNVRTWFLGEKMKKTCYGNNSSPVIILPNQNQDFSNSIANIRLTLTPTLDIEP